MNTIFEEVRSELKKSHDLVLISIISQSGSSPRGIGAMMLAGSQGRILGTVGGGAVEKNCEQYALQLLEERRSLAKAFTLTSGGNEDIGMVCGGNVEIWFQYIDASLPYWKTFTEKLLQLLEDQQEAWLVFNLDGGLPALLSRDGRLLSGTIADGTASLLSYEYRKTERSFYLPLPVCERAVIFGGGHCAQALAPILKTVGFRVTVMDNRPELATPDLFPDARQILCGNFKKISDFLTLSRKDYVVVMTNGHSYDLEVLLQVLQDPPAYVGAIGSKNKVAFINRKLKEAGLPEEIIQKVHSPIGTPIKAVTPEEIAISIAGEMIYERALLREKHSHTPHKCPMHE